MFPGGAKQDTKTGAAMTWTRVCVCAYGAAFLVDCQHCKGVLSRGKAAGLSVAYAAPRGFKPVGLPMPGGGSEVRDV